LRRFIAHDIETRIARALIAGDLDQHTTVVVDEADGEITVVPDPSADAARKKSKSAAKKKPATGAKVKRPTGGKVKRKTRSK